MKKMITLKNVIDTRTGLFHSVAVIDEKKARFFTVVETDSSEENKE